MAQQERAVRTRRAVLEAAAGVFAERGYAAATIAEILNRAGVTKGALYFHFDSKAALARGVLEERISAARIIPGSGSTPTVSRNRAASGTVTVPGPQPTSSSRPRPSADNSRASRGTRPGAYGSLPRS